MSHRFHGVPHSTKTAAARKEFVVHKQIGFRVWSCVFTCSLQIRSEKFQNFSGKLRARDFFALAKGATTGPTLITNLAIIYAWTSEKDLALEQQTLSAQIPAGVTYCGLKLDPEWDVLRSDPSFDKILASLAPK
jgi:hypothetical protein